LIYLNPALLRDVAQDLDIDPTRVDVVPRVATPDPLLHSFGDLLRSEAANPLRGAALTVGSLVRALAVHLFRRHSSLAVTIPPFRQALTSRRLNRVADYMSAHLDRPISVSELAGVCGLSATYFTRAFREAVGKPPHAYLIDLRLERAVDLLEHTRLSITEIALSCGFDQPQYFATQFGFTPSLWRMERGL
jgi:AraC family transcriptional regulator